MRVRDKWPEYNTSTKAETPGAPSCSGGCPWVGPVLTLGRLTALQTMQHNAPTPTPIQMTSF